MALLTRPDVYRFRLSARVYSVGFRRRSAAEIRKKEPHTTHTHTHTVAAAELKKQTAEETTSGEQQILGVFTQM